MIFVLHKFIKKNKQPTIALNTAQGGNISSFVSISADLCEVSSAVFTVLQNICHVNLSILHRALYLHGYCVARTAGTNKGIKP